MSRAVWKGAIVFGLVHVPVELYPGAKDNNLDFFSSSQPESDADGRDRRVRCRGLDSAAVF